MNDKGSTKYIQVEQGTSERNLKFALVIAELKATDILKIIALSGSIVITCLSIICAYFSGLMIGVLFIASMIVFILFIIKTAN